MSISEVPSSSNETLSINNATTPPKGKWSMGSLVAHFKVKTSIFKPKSEPIGNTKNAATSSATTNNTDDHHGRPLALSNLIHQDLIFMKEALAEVKKYVDNMDLQINQADEKFEELQGSMNSERELAELKKAIAKLKSQIPSQLKIQPAGSNEHRRSWPNINKAGDKVIENLYGEPMLKQKIGFEGVLKVFSDLPMALQNCLLCFFWFPPMATIQIRVMLYLWIGCHFFLPMQGYKDDSGNDVLNMFIAKGLIEPVYLKCRPVPDSCRMSLTVRSVLSTKAKNFHVAVNYNLVLDTRIAHVGQKWCCGLINFGEAVIDGKPEIFENTVDMSFVNLGRWQRSATHHIEVADTKILDGLKSMKGLRFLSLQGISLITELPLFIPNLSRLKILDLRACHNLEVIPDGIGFLWNLTHLDMSECYFLEYMPRSLASLSRLEVLKGFFIGDTKSKRRSCTLEDLSRLRHLRKLNIYTSMRDFPTHRQLDALHKLGALRKLTISWGGCTLQGRNDTNRLERLSDTTSLGIPLALEKLDLQCFHETYLPNWLRLGYQKGLKKLYIRGGPLFHIGQLNGSNDDGVSKVEILRLNYLHELQMDWTQLRALFPELNYLHKVDCPQLTDFPCDENGVWIDKQVVDRAEVRLQQQCGTSGTSSSSVL